MNTHNLATPSKKIYQQPVVKVIAIQAGRSILLKTSDPTETGSAFDNIE